MYKMTQSMLGRSCILCFETVLGVDKITLTRAPTTKNKKYIKTYFSFVMIF